MTECSVTFMPHGKTIRVGRGTDLMSAAVKCGIILNATCGGDGICGKCRVRITRGDAKTEPSPFIAHDERVRGVVLACQTLVEGDLEVVIPKESLGAHQTPAHDSQEFTRGIILDREKFFEFSPLVRKIYLKLSAPTDDDATGDLDRICEALEPELGGLHISTRLANVKHLGEVLRDGNFSITVTIAFKDDTVEILGFEQGDTSRSGYAFAFDVGTTTIVGQMVELSSGKIVGTRIAFNKQSAYGSDVITRIVYAGESNGLERLNQAAVDTMNEIIGELVSGHDVAIGDIYAIVCAGNMTMMHLLLRIDPASIRKAPYVPTTSVFPAIHPSEAGLEINPKGIVSFIPGVTAYIGGDIVSGILACGLSDSEELSLLADIGTNGEIVLGNKEWMIGAAASAGPAFEGSGLSCGMKAVNGAIQKVVISEELDILCEAIGGEKPIGICGSGYIDLLCQMLKKGIVGKDGKIQIGKDSRRIRARESVREFVLVFARDSATGRDIVITEDDIENLKRSKGAIYSAIIALLNKVGKTVSEIKKIFIAGGFGNYLNIENSIFIGLLPDTERSVFSFIGNSSLAGARMSLLSRAAFEKTHEIYRKVTYLDLSAEPDYMDEYIASLFFPHTDKERFPSVRL